MKALFFQAAASAPHPKVLGAFQGQTGATLHPFNRFLGQAIYTARERQFRYQLPWEKVQGLTTLRLEPLDTRLRIPRRAPGQVIRNWPAGKVLDVTQKLMVINRGAMVGVVSAAMVEGRPVLEVESPLLPGDQVFWCGHLCEVVPEGEVGAPKEIKSRDGRLLRLALKPSEEDSCWVLTIQGILSSYNLIVDGSDVEAEDLPPFQDLRRLSGGGQVYPVQDGQLRVEELPTVPELEAEDGRRFSWKQSATEGRQGCWIQLLEPEKSDNDETMDPRAAFCEDGVEEVWISRRKSDGFYRVMRVDRDRYQLLLKEYPPKGTPLVLPIDLRNLYLQQRALRQLSNAPLPHHQGLLRLCEDPAHARWPQVHPTLPVQWYSLTDASRSGAEEQRAFVAKALASPDFAFLEGPPGSGKTTAICELIQQLVVQGKRILLCASTHVAIDNVLERLLSSTAPVDAVRIGQIDKVDDKVQACQLDARKQALLERWRQNPAMGAVGDGELAEMAERTIIMASNLTCGTTMGIVRHPLFAGRDEDMQVFERPITTFPHWDVLIVDEASKTPIQDFLVPGLMAKRWIIVGDVRQLPPFADRSDIVANLRDLVDGDRHLFPADHQRACLLLYRLQDRRRRQEGMRWLISESSGVLDCIGRELAKYEKGIPIQVCRILERPSRLVGPVVGVTLEQLQKGAPEALFLAAADWVLVPEDLLKAAGAWLPSHLLHSQDLKDKLKEERHPRHFRQGWWLARTKEIPEPYRDRDKNIQSFKDAEAYEQDWLRNHDLAGELAWRLTRLHELRYSQNKREKDRLQQELDKKLQPLAVDISEQVAEIQDIGLPSILEVLQEGIGAERSKRPSALTEGMRKQQEVAFVQRFGSLSYQHRMHAQISEFPRAQFYQGSSLMDANTIDIRDSKIAWSFGNFRGRRLWVDVAGREGGGVNNDEVRVIRGVLRDFLEWVRRVGPPARGEPRTWEVACLSFYVKQEKAIAQMLRELTGDQRQSRFQVPGLPVEVVCGTVDRFQGREADLVLLSLRNTRRVGFLDSPNRLNVAITRARQQLMVIGNAAYFLKCGVAELEALSKQSPTASPQDVQRWNRGK